MKRRKTPKKKAKKSKKNFIRQKITPTKKQSEVKEFAQPHSTNANQEFMEKNFPKHTPTLWRYIDHELFLVQCGDHAVMRQLRDEVRYTDSDTLVRLCHDLPAKMNEIYRLKGKKILSNFDPRKSPFACHCNICSS